MIQVLTGLLCLTTVSLAAAAELGEWPQWRGPNRDCFVSGDAQWPDQLADGVLTPMYEVPLGPSYSGPIVSVDHVFVTETLDDSNEVVRALDRVSGVETWRVEWPGSIRVPFFAAANGSWIRSTPAFDGTRLFVAGMEDVLVCLDAASGNELWKVDFRERYGTEHQSFGFVCSPLVDGGSVIVQTAAGLISIDTETGESRWRALQESGGMMGGAFSSPVIAEIGGKRQLVVQTRSRLAGVDLSTGSELWTADVPSFRGMNILTPTVLGDAVFTSSYGGGSRMLDISFRDGKFGVSERWKSKSEAYMSSPVVVDGRIYLHLRNQRFTCVDPTSGQNVWTSRPFGKYWSMAASGHRLLSLDERGDLLLIDANADKFALVDSRHIGDASAWAHIAVAGDQVFVRQLDRLTAFRWAR